MGSPVVDVETSGPPDTRKFRPSPLFLYRTMANRLLPEHANRLLVANAFLEEIERGKIGGKTKPRLQAISIAHGLAFDPHVDGRLRLTPVGVQRLRVAS